jgi:hypothetical protein
MFSGGLSIPSIIRLYSVTSSIVDVSGCWLIQAAGPLSLPLINGSRERSKSQVDRIRVLMGLFSGRLQQVGDLYVPTSGGKLWSLAGRSYLLAEAIFNDSGLIAQWRTSRKSIRPDSKSDNRTARFLFARSITA